jgi:hypothetical protein
VNIKNQYLRTNPIKFSRILHREGARGWLTGCKQLVLWTLFFFNVNTLHSQQTIQVIGDVRQATDTCKCLFLLNRDRKAIPIDLSRHRWQNIFRDNYKNNGELEKKMIENYFWKCGDYQLEEAEFKQIVPFVQSQWGLIRDSTIFYINNKPFSSKRINFYSHSHFDFVFGYGWVIADGMGNIVGFQDYYNFNKAPFFGKRRRKFIAELATRIMRLYSRKTSAFTIYYGIIPNNKLAGALK